LASHTNKRLSAPRPLLFAANGKVLEYSNISRISRFYSSASTKGSLTHIDQEGKPAMVNVSGKTATKRQATAEGRILIPEMAYMLVAGDKVHRAEAEMEARMLKSKSKGDVCSIAQLAGIMYVRFNGFDSSLFEGYARASKRTSDLIPLCHPLSLSHVSIELTPGEETFGKEDGMAKRYFIHCQATVKCDGKTGVEMEALTGVSVSLLTIWDMLKAVAGKEMTIEGIHVSQKSGGKTGNFERRI
jgi:molybdenum cofactor biosynthesis enzyme